MATMDTTIHVEPGVLTLDPKFEKAQEDRWQRYLSGRPHFSSESSCAWHNNHGKFKPRTAEALFAEAWQEAYYADPHCDNCLRAFEPILWDGGLSHHCCLSPFVRHFCSGSFCPDCRPLYVHKCNAYWELVDKFRAGFNLWRVYGRKSKNIYVLDNIWAKSEYADANCIIKVSNIHNHAEPPFDKFWIKAVYSAEQIRDFLSA